MAGCDSSPGHRDIRAARPRPASRSAGLRTLGFWPLSGAIALPAGRVVTAAGAAGAAFTCDERGLDTGYSAAMASSMLTRAARRAGMVPAISPVAAPTTT